MDRVRKANEGHGHSFTGLFCSIVLLFVTNLPVVRYLIDSSVSRSASPDTRPLLLYCHELPPPVLLRCTNTLSYSCTVAMKIALASLVVTYKSNNSDIHLGGKHQY